MKRKLLLLTLLLSAATSTQLMAQCPGTCPNNDTQCNDDPNCCIVDTGGGGNSISSCLTMGATILRIKENSTINSGDISGVKFCLQNNDLTVGEDVIVDGNTCFEANGNNGVSVTIGGTTFTFNNNDGSLDALNDAIGNLSGGAMIGDVAQMLPVTLQSFAASESNNGQVLIEWITSAESDNDYFLLEHSRDGKTFYTLDKVQSYGNSTEKQHYTYHHNPAQGGTHYYRLWQYDFDGGFTDLGLSQIRQSDKGQIAAYPNPVTAGQVLTLPGLAEEEVNCSLVNLTGQRFQLTSENNTYRVPAQIPPGLYFLHVIFSAGQQTLPVQVQ